MARNKERTPTKEERVVQSVQEFKDSQKTSDDYMRLAGTFHSVLKQGDGLGWFALNNAIRRGLGEQELTPEEYELK
jgi:acyl-CoA synthetase (NDP forming)